MSQEQNLGALKAYAMQVTGDDLVNEGAITALEEFAKQPDSLADDIEKNCVDPALERKREWNRRKTAFKKSVPAEASAKLDACDQIEAEKAARRLKCSEAESAINAKWARDTDYCKARDRAEHANARYQDLYDKEGRGDAKVVRMLPYAALLLTIGTAEWLLNYQTFLGLLGVPAQAAGATALVAFFVAAASHVHGTFLRQWGYLFGLHLTSSRKTSQWLVLIGVSVCLVAALVAVGLSRYYWALDLMSKVQGATGGGSIIDVPTPVLNIPQKVMTSVIFNVLIWMLGLVIAYWMHDPNPEFSAAREEMEKADKVHRKYRVKIDDELRAQQESLEKDVVGLENKLKALKESIPVIHTDWATLGSYEERLAQSLADEVGTRRDACVRACDAVNPEKAMQLRILAANRPALELVRSVL